MTDIFLNEKFIGTVESNKEFLKYVRSERRKGKLPSELNIRYDDSFDEVYIDTSTGRARRPLIIVENSKSKLTEKHIEQLKNNEIKWSDLIKEGVIEYLDASEEEMALIALTEEEITKDHTHIEISPQVILGVTANLIPFSNFGGSSRLIRGSKIQKQSLGLYAANFLLRMDTDVSILHYPQKPLTKTFMHDILGYEKHPAGQNITIAIMSYEGYNMDDAIIINRASVDRGLGRSSYFKPYSAEEFRYQGGLVDEICIPDKEVKGYRSEKDYRLLEEDGIVYTSAKIKEEDILIGKISPPRFLGSFEEFSIAANTKRESSIEADHGAVGVVDMTLITENEEGNRLIQTRLRELRIPEIGDKFASRHGQKGIIGHLADPEDIPFTVSGMVPDIIFSPHGIPSRMTVSHLLEVISGKVAALSGEYIDGTTFDSMPEKQLRKMLRSLGFRESVEFKIGLDTLRGTKITITRSGLLENQSMGSKQYILSVE